MPDSFEPPKRRRERRAPKGRQNLTQLLDEHGEAIPGTALARLQERGFVHELLGELKSGKEATVYLGRSPRGLLAVKIYRDAEVRSFKNDASYTAGRWIADQRIAKAVKSRTRAGRSAMKLLWAGHEYAMLWRLYQAGIPVPEPMVGPQASDISQAGEVVLMRFIGEGEEPAPRLADAVLSPDEAQEAFRQSVDLMTRLYRIGLVHGDYSTYNLLWHRGQVIIMDLPQMMEIEQPAAREKLLQDVQSLCVTFGQLGVEADPATLLRVVTAPAPATVSA